VYIRLSKEGWENKLVKEKRRDINMRDDLYI